MRDSEILILHIVSATDVVRDRLRQVRRMGRFLCAAIWPRLARSVGSASGGYDMTISYFGRSVASRAVSGDLPDDQVDHDAYDAYAAGDGSE